MIERKMNNLPIFLDVDRSVAVIAAAAAAAAATTGTGTVPSTSTHVSIASGLLLDVLLHLVLALVGIRGIGRGIVDGLSGGLCLYGLGFVLRCRCGWRRLRGGLIVVASTVSGDPDPCAAQSYSRVGKHLQIVEDVLVKVFVGHYEVSLC